jgi:hypothetical protein
MAIGRIPEPGTGIPESIIAAKGDVLTGTANDVPAVITVGANETRLVAASGEATGLKYVADTTNYAVAAKGDLLVGTAADTLAPLTVGANGTTLVADSAQATGLKWATPATPGYVGVGLSNYYTTIAGTANVPFTIPYANADNWDTNTFHNPSSNNTRITIPTGYGGKYLISSFAWPETFASYFIMSINLNGAQMLGNPLAGIANQGEWQRQASQLVANCTLILTLSAGDYIEQTIQMGTTASYRYITNLQATYLGA